LRSAREYLKKSSAWKKEGHPTGGYHASGGKGELGKKKIDASRGGNKTAYREKRGGEKFFHEAQAIRFAEEKRSIRNRQGGGGKRGRTENESRLPKKKEAAGRTKNGGALYKRKVKKNAETRVSGRKAKNILKG